MKNPFLLGSLAVIATMIAPAAHAADVVGVAMANPQLSTLVKAVKAAGLVDALKSAKGITVFAPTNTAFAKLPPPVLASLLKPENKAQLAALLKYHVVPKKIMAAEVVGMKGPADVPTLNGATIHVTPKPPMVNNAKIIKTDIAADNGVIHLIDTVIMPTKPSTKVHKAKMKMNSMDNKMAPTNKM